MVLLDAQEIEGGLLPFQDLYHHALATAPENATVVVVSCEQGSFLSFLWVKTASSGKKLNILGVGRVESAQAAAGFADATLDFVFLDGAHDFNQARDDIRAWLPKVRWGGVLAGHDYQGPWPGVKHAVREHFSPHELSIEGVLWMYRKEVPHRGHWARLPPDGAGWLLYLPFVNRADLLGNALGSVDEHAANVVVIDQSHEGEALGLHAGPLFRWTGAPRFSSVMTWMQRDAYRRGLRRFLFMHSDAEAAPGGIRSLLEEADHLDSSCRRWGVIFSCYDAIALFNPLATGDTGCWDETFLWYVSDVDYYNRLRWGGWSHHHLPQACAVHHGSQTLARLTGPQRQAVDQDHCWSIHHYRHKWGCAWTEGSCGRVWTIPYNGEAE